MANNYGLYQDGSNPVLWMVTEVPLTLGSADQAVNNLSFADAASIATYLSGNSDNTFKVGRPGDRHP